MRLLKGTPIYGGKLPHRRPAETTLLKEWMRARSISLAEFGRLVGCSPQTVQYWATGRVIPELPAAFMVEAVTGGGVPVSAWLSTEMGRMAWKRLEINQRRSVDATNR